jgi:hypothetical protein
MREMLVQPGHLKGGYLLVTPMTSQDRCEVVRERQHTCHLSARRRPQRLCHPRTHTLVPHQAAHRARQPRLGAAQLEGAVAAAV